MRASLTAFALMLIAACEERAQPPAVPHPESRPADPEAEIATPTTPTPAFVPLGQGGCARGYRPVDGACVHVRFAVSDEGALRAALDAYKRGAAPPMLGLTPVLPAPDAPKAARLDPGALTRRGANNGGDAKEKRLRELDAMLALAREKLAQRDAEAKAKRVDNAPKVAAKAGQARDDRDALERFARGLNAGNPGSGGTAPSAGAAGSEAARMDELSRVTSQLSGDQLKALTDELQKSGYNAGELDAILNQAHGDTAKP